jgi:hypothetical protein
MSQNKRFATTRSVETEKDHNEFWPEEQILGPEAIDFENATKRNQLVAFGGDR